MPFSIHPHMLAIPVGSTRQRQTRHAGSTALPRAQEPPAHGQIHRNGARPVQEFLALTGDGKLGTASPSISFALCAWPSIDALRCSIMASSSSSVSSLSGFLCSTLCSRGTSRARILRYAGCSLATFSIAFLPCWEMQQQRLHELLIEQVTRAVPVAGSDRQLRPHLKPHLPVSPK